MEKLLTTVYKSKITKFKLDKVPLKSLIHFLTYIYSLGKIFSHYKETCELLLNYPKIGEENNKYFVKKTIGNLLNCNIDVHSRKLMMNFQGME